MKKGNIAPDTLFDKEMLALGYAGGDLPKKLSELKSKYSLLVFGASWCPKCTEELTKIIKYYSKWKAQGVEVVFVSLDENKDLFESFASILPFISICDYQKWESPIVKDYYVFGTPTMYLLNDKREILFRPNSVQQMDSWADWNLVQRKK
ncbi:peroxiredoxin family protein [Flavobacterium sp. W22_SRS_FP1]|uniref:peroxiredoxin family protein n=1 Tax=Flavobacterium sp. W22_SRS_FP1 TaxID=3240276 RepID=UPI003F8F1D56